MADVNRVAVGLGVFLLVAMLTLIGCDSEAQRIREINEIVDAAGEEKTTLSAEVDPLDLEDGDCINSTLSKGVSIETVVIVPCIGPWQYRVLNSFDVTGIDEYPGEDFFDQGALERCDPGSTEFLHPSVEQWEFSGREVVCLQNSFGLPALDPDKLDRLVVSDSLGFGECFNEAPETGGLQVELVDCSGAWQYRVLNSFDVTGFDVTGIDDYPGEDFFDQGALERCDPRSTAFFSPSMENWEIGVRTVICVQENS